ncbi:MAG: peptide deformylase [Treponemataceae bacterium]|nr:MAG: peptide deformylase [Treponemataceae bacterium]
MEVLVLGNDGLRQKSEAVTVFDADVTSLAENMFALMQKKRGVGLAAPQVGVLKRVFVLQAEDGVKRIFVNPNIIETSKETRSMEEGCLSIPGIYHEIVRPSHIKVQAQDTAGKPFTLAASGQLARIILHEYDHLEGVLYIDRADETFRQNVTKKIQERETRRLQKLAEKKRKEALLAQRVEQRNMQKLLQKNGKSAVAG